jgi:hypothetical protein
MRILTLDKLKPFQLQQSQFDTYKEEDKERYKPLLDIHTTPDFSIASNSYMAAVIYNTEDHDLNYTFGNSLDMATTLIKANHNYVSERVNCKIILNRKEILEAIIGQFKALKALVKEKHNITIYNNETTTHISIDCENFKVHLTTETKDKYLDKKLSSNCGYTCAVSNQPDLECDFIQPEVGINIEEYKINFNTKYLIDFLNFMTGYDYITITTIGSPVSPIFCEKIDREVVLFPIR